VGRKEVFGALLSLSENIIPRALSDFVLPRRQKEGRGMDEMAERQWKRWEAVQREIAAQ